jgi:hypothetical protein
VQLKAVHRVGGKRKSSLHREERLIRLLERPYLIFGKSAYRDWLVAVRWDLDSALGDRRGAEIKLIACQPLTRTIAPKQGGELLGGEMGSQV